MREEMGQTAGKARTILISGGRVLDPSQGLDVIGDLMIVDGRIAGFGAGSVKNQELAVLDAQGCVVIPGFVDLHCHLREPGYEERETIATGTRAAAAGGFTTICCMPNTKPALDSAASLEYVQKVAKAQAVVRVLPIAATTKGQAGAELSEMRELARAGAVAFSDDGGAMTNSRLMRHALEYARMVGRPVIPHCEDADLKAGGVMNEGVVATFLGLRGIPAAAEEAIVARDIALAQLTGGSLHIAHVSTAGSVELIRAAKKKGVTVTAEATPHHLALTDQWVAGLGVGQANRFPYDTNTKVSPPLRYESNRLALVQGLKDGTLDAIATDHAPHSLVDKQCEYGVAAFGISGFETALGTLLGLVHRGEMELTLLIAKLTTGPARVFGLPYGSLRVGAPADVAIFDPEEKWVVDPTTFASKGRNTPLAGVKLRGRMVATLVGGRVVFATATRRPRLVAGAETTR